MSAAKAKAKAKSKHIDNEYQKKSTTVNEGALDNSYFVNAYLKKDDTWHLARIIYCRLSKDYDPKQKKTDSSYEYYVHYEKLNRRMDEWIPRNRIKPTDQLIDEEPELKKKRKHDEKKEFEENDEHEGMDKNALRMHEEHTRFKTIGKIEMGKFSCETWYYSPYPKGFHDIDTLYICEFCLNFYKFKNDLLAHSSKCPLTHPPGNEIYRDYTPERKDGVEYLSIFEIDGQRNNVYCENLCYISKLFLDHKNLSFDTEPFLFFVLCEADANGHHMVGYFSKEKENSQQGYNLSCFMCMPFHQRKGYGKFLITFSYELSIKEQKTGTPERPLSDLGRETYLSWWTQRIIEYIKENKNEDFSIADISKATMMKESDIIWTLEQKDLVKYNNGQIYLCTEEDQLTKIYNKSGRPGVPVKVDQIHWVPYRAKGVESGNK